MQEQKFTWTIRRSGLKCFVLLDTAQDTEENSHKDYVRVKTTCEGLYAVDSLC